MNDKFQICRGSSVDLIWHRHETEPLSRALLSLTKWADPELQFKGGNAPVVLTEAPMDLTTDHGTENVSVEMEA